MKLSKEIHIGDYKICENSPTYIIAEIGTNHNHGDMGIIKRMILEAKEGGADAVKFQTFKADSLIIRDAPQASRLDEIIEKGETWFDLLTSEELDYDKHYEILDFCKEHDISFLSTPYDKESTDFLCEELNVPAIKIASADIINHPLLEHCARKERPIILSTGMSDLDEVVDAINVIVRTGNNDIILLHCTGVYPTNIEDCNLNVITLFQEKFNCIVGYSDHCLSPLVPISAVSLGARVYEKHFTLSKSMPGADHKTSLEPQELKKMVDDIRQTEISMGLKEKHVLASEVENQSKYRRSLVATVDIEKDQLIAKSMLGAKRPGTGLLAKEESRVTGLRAKVPIKKDTLLANSMIY
jgi:N,N'-diacetyllegionaminate synthase